MVHSLKTTPQYFEDVASGRKPFEVRENDRNFAVGDFLALNEWDIEHYTGRFLLEYVTYVLAAPEYVKEGYVVLGIVPAEIILNGHVMCAFIKKQHLIDPVYAEKLHELTKLQKDYEMAK